MSCHNSLTVRTTIAGVGEEQMFFWIYEEITIALCPVKTPLLLATLLPALYTL